MAASEEMTFKTNKTGMKKEDKLPTEHSISTTPFPNSKKVFVQGEIHDIQVAMREISLGDTERNGKPVEKNAPVVVYDTSGPYTDVNTKIDIKLGLPKLRQQWG